MPFILALASLGITALIGVERLLDKADDASSKVSGISLNLAGLILVALGAFLVYKEMK